MHSTFKFPIPNSKSDSFSVLLAVIAAASFANSAWAQTAPTAAARLQLVADDGPKILTPSAPTTLRTAQVPNAPQLPAPTGTGVPGSTMQIRPPGGVAPQPDTAPRFGGDPTVPDASIRELLGEKRPEAPGAAPAFPEIRLRARIITPDKPPSALIEIGGAGIRTATNPPSGEPYAPRRALLSGTYRTIREGDEFVVTTGDAPTPIRVAKLSASEVLLEVVSRKTMIRLD
jgi:hypothetical protein